MNYNQKKDVRNQISDVTPNNLYPGCENYEQRLREQAQSSNSYNGNGGNVYVNNHMAAGSNMLQNFGTVNNFNETRNEIDPHEAFREVVKKMINQNIITKKQDFAILYKLELEMNELGVESVPSMLKLIAGIIDIPDKLKPAESSFKNFEVGRDIYPNWDFGNIDEGLISHKKTVAKHYIRDMASYGYQHPYILQCEKCLKNATY